jgi:energy-coupling factor transport system permease protein
MLITAIFFVKNFIGFGVLAVLTLFLARVSKIPVKILMKSLKPLILIMSVTAALNVFMTEGAVLWAYGFLKITKEGLLMSAFMLLRVIFLVSGSSFLTYTTSPITMTSGMESMLEPLKKLKFPSHEIAMMTSIALRFIPTLIEEADKIMAAQKARGANLSDGGLMKRARALIPILIPLFISAFRRADELAVAMESRCYNGGENRTKLNQLKYGKNDIFAALIFAVCIITVVISGNL